MSFDDAVTAAMVSDALDALGSRHQVLSSGIQPLTPDARIKGHAATLQLAPAGETDPSRPYDDAITFIDDLRPGAVAVIATGDSTATAIWGQLFSAAAMGRSAAGVITDGLVRDTHQIIALGFPVFASGRRPVDFRGRLRVVATGEPVVLSGIQVRADDYVVADVDGVVIVPKPMVSEVSRVANARARTESTVLEELLGGSRLDEVWRRHGVL